MVEFLGHIVGHTGKDKSTIILSDMNFPSERSDEIKEKLLKHEHVTDVRIVRNNREIELSLDLSVEECPDCPEIFKEFYSSVLNDTEK